MLKLKYDVKCGWNQLYVVEKDVEFDVSFLCNKEAMNLDEDDEILTEQELYDKYKNLHNDKLLNELGVDMLLYDITVEDYAHGLFKEVYESQHCFPGICKISNIDLILLDDNTDESDLKNLKYLRAGEVLSELNISRSTLTNYIKRGLLKTIKINGQYRYETESVIYLKSLIGDNKNKRFSKKEEKEIKKYYLKNNL